MAHAVMNNKAAAWLEREYLSCVMQAERLLGKERVVDFYYGAPFFPADGYMGKEHLLAYIDKLLQTARNNLEDRPPFFEKSLCVQRFSSLRGVLLEGGMGPILSPG